MQNGLNITSDFHAYNIAVVDLEGGSDSPA